MGKYLARNGSFRSKYNPKMQIWSFIKVVFRFKKMALFHRGVATIQYPIPTEVAGIRHHSFKVVVAIIWHHSLGGGQNFSPIFGGGGGGRAELLWPDISIIRLDIHICRQQDIHITKTNVYIVRPDIDTLKSNFDIIPGGQGGRLGL